MIIDNIAKRFKFDLAMGIFNPHEFYIDYNGNINTNGNKVYYFYSFDFALLDSFERVLKYLGFRENHSLTDNPCGIFINIDLKTYSFYGWQELIEDEDNKIPKYIKELIDNFY